MEKQNVKIILASSSPRREQLCKQMFDDVVIMPQNVEEISHFKQPAKMVCELAEIKINGLDKMYPNEVVVGADTIVYFRNKIYGKPHNAECAEQFLQALQGNWHTVYTGVCICGGGKKIVFCEKSLVKFHSMNNQQITSYVQRKKPFDKAGAYGIQDEEVVEKFKGSYSNIVGLPMEKLLENIAQMEKICKK